MSAPRLPTADDVRNDVLAAIPPSTAATGFAAAYDKVAKANDYFEALLFTALLRQAVAAGWTYTILDPQGTAQTQLLFRAAPGNFYGSKQAYTHAVLSHPGAYDLEVHIGVKVSGQSDTLHEADLLVLTRATGDGCRADHEAPAYQQLLTVFEAKFISANTVPLGYGRGLLGLAHDLDFAPRAALVTTRPGPSVERLLDHGYPHRTKHVGDVLGGGAAVLDRALDSLLADWQPSGRQWRRHDHGPWNF